MTLGEFCKSPRKSIKIREDHSHRSQGAGMLLSFAGSPSPPRKVSEEQGPTLTVQPGCM